MQIPIRILALLGLGLVSLSGCMKQEQAAATACESTATGDLRLQQLDSRIFGNNRTLRVLLPPGYDAPANAERRYPVLYMLDGQNVFDACLSDVSHKEWHADETLYQLIGEGRIPAMIVVGIDHAGKDRGHEYLPYKDEVGNPGMPEPAGQRFPDFLTDEVMPAINSRYRTQLGDASTGLGGSSYGGVATLYALLARPDVFGYGLVESPTMWVGKGQLVRDTNPLGSRPRKVFVGYGGREGGGSGDDQILSLIRQVEANFHAAGYGEAEFRFVLDAEARHDEPAWAARLPGALEFLYGPATASAE